MNSYSITDISNLAMSHLMHGQAIADVTSEQSPQANACRVYLPIAIGTTLRDFAWPFATAYANLALVSTFPSNQGYAYGYAYRRPADCVTIRRINSGNRVDNVTTRIPFTEATDGQGGLILTDVPPTTGFLGAAQIEYTQYVDNPAFWSEDFVLALSYKLAYLAAPRVTGGDGFKTGDRAQGQYFEQLSIARANALNEMSVGPDVESSFVLAREGGTEPW